MKIALVLLTLGLVVVEEKKVKNREKPHWMGGMVRLRKAQGAAASGSDIL